MESHPTGLFCGKNGFSVNSERLKCDRGFAKIFKTPPATELSTTPPCTLIWFPGHISDAVAGGGHGDRFKRQLTTHGAIRLGLTRSRRELSRLVALLPSPCHAIGMIICLPKG